MSTDSPNRPAPISPGPLPPGARLSRERLIATFQAYGKPRERWRVGGEFERAVVRGDGRPVAYDDEDGIRWILRRLSELEAGWADYEEEGKLIALIRPDSSSITLEPGGQVELSGAPHHSLLALAREMNENRAAMLALAEGHDLRWIACGLSPICDMDDVSWMPKGRYRVMREYLPRYGDLAHFMMKGTCSVQANFDYADEADCARKVRLCAGIAPLTTAIFANSPLYKNQDTGFQSYRGHVWTRTDPARTGFPPGLRADYTHERWVDYLLDVPMMFYKRRGEWTPAHGRSFRSYMEAGIDGHFPNDEDWALHQTSVFPEVRIKHTIEVRGADCVGPELALGFCAFFTGLLYSEAALDAGLALAEAFEQEGEREQRFDMAARLGLGGVVGGRSLASWSAELGRIAQAGLAEVEPAALPLLEPLLAQIATGKSPAESVLDAWRRDPSPGSVLAAVAY
jgi:glutamate--cysteine ligase